MRKLRTTAAAAVFAGLAVAGWAAVAGSGEPGDREKSDRKPRYTPDKKVQAVIDQVGRECRRRTIYMIGPAKGARLAELVRERKPRRVVECGTAVGYSGLWMARELKAAGRGRLITIEIDEERAEEARANFKRAGLEEFVEVRVGDARQLVKEIEGPIDFVHIDCNYSNYHPCFLGLEPKLAQGAVVVADNAGIGASGMKDYLEYVRSRYPSRTEWFELDLPWARRDAMEITKIDAPREAD